MERYSLVVTIPLFRMVKSHSLELETLIDCFTSVSIQTEIVKNALHSKLACKETGCLDNLPYKIAFFNVFGSKNHEHLAPNKGRFEASKMVLLVHVLESCRVLELWFLVLFSEY